MSSKRKSTSISDDIDSKAPKVEYNENILNCQITSSTCINKCKGAWEDRECVSFTDGRHAS